MQENISNERGPKLLYSVVIPGRCYVKKNTGKVLRFSGRTLKVSSPQYSLWESLAKAPVFIAARGIDTITVDIQVKMIFYFKNRQAEADLSNLFEGPADLLKKMNVIEDDNLIESFDGSRRIFGDQNPRTEIFIYEFLRGAR